ncbi:hypothetical protein EJ05DRAFT_418442, partial [Pseudovirgaria hyperparasitica]
HLLGLRGLLTLLTTLTFFLTTFVPSAVKTADPSAQTPGPLYATILRKTLGPLFWNQFLLYSFFIFLSARSVCIPFLHSHARLDFARVVFQRGVRLWTPTAVALLCAWGAMSKWGHVVERFRQRTGNSNMQPLFHIKDTGVFFNALFNVFWVNKAFFNQAASTAFPGQMLWMVSVIYQQSYTVYMTMLITPYTLPTWRIKSLTALTLAAYWVQSWAWYSITALLLSDTLINTSLATHLRRPITLKLGTRRLGYWALGLPTWPLFVLVMLTGAILSYVYAAYRPGWTNRELVAHAGMYYSGGLNTRPDVREPQARVDNYLVVVGFFGLLESCRAVRWFCRLPLFVFLGRRSLSYFLTTPIVLYTAGIGLFDALHFYNEMGREAAVAVVAVIMAPAVVAAAEVFYWVVDRPSIAFARWAWAFAT